MSAAEPPAFTRPHCPLLPEVDAVLDPSVTRSLGHLKCDRFYLACLRYAQSLWCQGKPAQAILQLNKSFMADLRGDEDILSVWPPPYAALAWFLRHHRTGDFIGNPVRHFQHLATRVTGERRELRSWRAWACYYLSWSILDKDAFPPDRVQIEKEGIAIPSRDAVIAALSQLGWASEAAVLSSAWTAWNGT